MIIIDPRPRPLAIVRMLLLVVGLSVIIFGILWTFAEVPADQYGPVAVWLVGALILSDGIIAPLVVAFGLLGKRTAQRIGAVATTVARTALIVAACCSLVAIPGIAVRIAGPRNPTIHSVDYLVVLAVMWVIAVIIAVAAATFGALQSSRVRARTK